MSRADLSDALADRERVLRAFVNPDGTFKSEPSKHRKRLVLLAYLVEDFAFETGYDEPQVNAIIRAHHPDVASWRRYLVDEGLMTRHGGEYRRARVCG